VVWLRPWSAIRMSRKAVVSATGVVLVGGAMASRRVREPVIRTGIRVASPLLVKPLALWLTHMGIV
jgi:hypothetical protein